MSSYPIAFPAAKPDPPLLNEQPPAEIYAPNGVRLALSYGETDMMRASEKPPAPQDQVSHVSKAAMTVRYIATACWTLMRCCSCCCALSLEQGRAATHVILSMLTWREAQTRVQGTESEALQQRLVRSILRAVRVWRLVLATAILRMSWVRRRVWMAFDRQNGQGLLNIGQIMRDTLLAAT